MQIVKSNFGNLSDGGPIYKYKLINDTNSFVSIINYGGIINEIYVPDKDGKLENVVISLPNPKDYENNTCYFGAAVGRIAGRISNSSFKIDNNFYTLEKNCGKHSLHGGFKGLSRVIWNVKEINQSDFIGVELSYFSKDMENGFPGNMNIKVLYTFNNNNELKISYTADTDKKTIINMTNHSYFNLSGNYKEDIYSHYLTINADKIFELDQDLIPTGNVLSVGGTPFDFRKPKMVGTGINEDNQQLKNGNGYDHPFILNKDKDTEISICDRKSGRILEITTDQKSVVLYTGNSITNNYTYFNGLKSRDRSALCLETQYYPDAINQKNVPSNILNPGETYKASTTYHFKII
ncbi:MAG: aldose epimerase family protein [Clostridiaceae bacterium]